MTDKNSLEKLDDNREVVFSDEDGFTNNDRLFEDNDDNQVYELTIKIYDRRQEKVSL